MSATTPPPDPEVAIEQGALDHALASLSEMRQRAEKLLESAAVKLSSVLTDLHGVTGRDIMAHLIAGERNPAVLAQLARARARRKITELEEALEGAEFFTPGHAARRTR